MIEMLCTHRRFISDRCWAFDFEGEGNTRTSYVHGTITVWDTRDDAYTVGSRYELTLVRVDPGEKEREQ